MKNYSCLLIITMMLLFACQKQSSYYINAYNADGLKKFLTYTGEPMYLLSAHRGGPEPDFPENCTATFEHTLRHCYAMMEIDPRYSKDSVMVVHHDETLERTTTGKGRVNDFTASELKKLNLKDLKGNPTNYQMQTLDEMLAWAKGKTILLLDKKDVSIEQRARKVTECKAESCVILLAYTYEEALACYRINPNIMMQVFIKNHAEIEQFSQTGIPWDNVVVFIGHQKPEDMSFIHELHKRGVLCIMGTSRNLDRDYIEGKVEGIESLKSGYHLFYDEGVDILETDIPVPVSRIIKQNISLSK